VHLKNSCEVKYQKLLQENQTEDDLLEAFRLLDKNEDGFISFDELK
jgi:Ca2+-binding EF-hand superfamily protein